ncbi:hypothetical protein H5410_004189 [Solanum commersonii]|uniref:Uncharacterized protein n=1 Tax=Solanum commersonii TaxID=4109 RepID=A0A9J6B711_SOLCO|nr:hypothetical protein H5410_004189 [Solanum commersonii]
MDAQSSKLFKEDCEGRKISHVTMIMDHPTMVWKLWYLILTFDPLFINIYHLKRSSDSPSILLSINEFVRLLVELKPDDYSHPIHKAIVLSPIFICLLSGRRYDEDHRIYISNPILGGYFKVKLPEWEKRIRRVSYAFYFSKAFGQFKVLRSVVRKSVGSPKVSELEIQKYLNWRFIVFKKISVVINLYQSYFGKMEKS